MLQTCGYIYLVRAVGTNRYKIGRTKNPERRLERLKQQSPFSLKLVEIFHTEDCVTEEKRLHRIAAKYRSHGEWFDLPDWWLENVADWFHNPKCHKYVEVGAESGIIRYAVTEAVSYSPKRTLVITSILVPNSPEEIERAISFLAFYTRSGSLKEKNKAELVALIGACPANAEEARLWKEKIKAAAKKLNHQPQKPYGVVV